MIEKSPPYFSLTGPPGAGKTTLLSALPASVRTVAEPARRVLKKARKTGSRATGDKDPRLFVEHMLNLACADYDAAQGVTVFDRALPDLLAFCFYYVLPDGSVREAISSRPYRPSVFWVPAWREIYRQDDERTLDFDGAAAFGALIKTAYQSCGYKMIEVPTGTVEARAAFICERIGA